MSLGKRLVQSARKEAALGRPLPLQADASETLPDGAILSARAVLADSDKYTKMTGEIRVSLEGAPAKRGLTPQQRAEKFAASTTYLSESLAFVETDEGGTATVRSTPATMNGRRSAYFEAQVKDDEVRLSRFQPDERGPGRQSVPFPLTDDSLARLVEDAANALQPKRERF